MPSAKQIKARKAFVKKYAKKGKRGDFRKRQKEVNKEVNEKGYLSKVKGYQVCSKCLKKKVGSRDAWFQDFTGQKRICNACIDKMRKAKN